jgi:hypothetical protein
MLPDVSDPNDWVDGQSYTETIFRDFGILTGSGMIREN